MGQLSYVVDESRQRGLLGSGVIAIPGTILEGEKATCSISAKKFSG